MASYITKLLGKIVQQPGDPTSASRVLPKDWNGQDLSVCVVGGTSGIGLEVTKALLSRGAYVAILGHNMSKGRAALEHLRETIGGGVHSSQNNKLNVDYYQVDLTSFKSIKTFVDAWNTMGRPLHVLACLAGDLLASGETTEQGGFNHTIATNYLGNFYLTHLLLPNLRNSAPCRIVWMSSVYEALGTVHWGDVGGQLVDGRRRRSSKPTLSAYCNANLMVLMAAQALARRLEACNCDNIKVVVVQPGLVNTPLYDTMDVWKAPFLSVLHKMVARVAGQDPAWGAGSALYAIAHPHIEYIGNSNKTCWGGYYGPPYAFPLTVPVLHTHKTTSPQSRWARDAYACDRLYDETVELLEEVLHEKLPNKLGSISSYQGEGGGAYYYSGSVGSISSKEQQQGGGGMVRLSASTPMTAAQHLKTALEGSGVHGEYIL